MPTQPSTTSSLAALQPCHDFFVGIDSDGCVFDTMEIKQKQCFHGLIVEHWDLQPIEKAVREGAEFINLYSAYRGRNRFLCLVDAIDCIRDRADVRASGVELPAFSRLREWIAGESNLGNPTLKAAVERTGDPELARVLAWSEAVNRRVAAVVRHVPPFPWARRSLLRLREVADLVVVSQTPVDALVREWDENGMRDWIRIIAGQEQGTKTEQLRLATGGRYAPGRLLMIGDAPGDLQAAREAGASFYPITPGREDASWQRFHEEALKRFLDGAYAGDYEEELVRAFRDRLPAQPPWN